ncbi:beta-galactosidase BgaS [Picrophilus oshimae]|uniref:Beta-galactosidase n=1 Tax=Picrophilus torridus (strain ATCC 700027 / DSM 9790 / JCM 10055 / NBRC 100828 / KAW 2/3) TaxID=1122961 RepID=A0A8G2L7A3_PICTO|nr:beta-galactosidase BgaS [Picrophilus oshimae]SMD30897.1 beta-galactosidase [Picrophilus oshimae DSM 9789]
MVDKNFKFGFSECGFQFEMGLSNPDMNSDWYIWSNDKRNIAEHYVSGDLPQNGVAYWDLYEKDHDIASSLGMNAARLGIEWSRIFPESTESVDIDVEYNGDDIVSTEISIDTVKELEKLANNDAVKHYREMFGDFKSRGKFLIINLYHWTIPSWLNDPSKQDYSGRRAIGGCFNNKIIVEFAKYAGYISYKFNDLADRWSTMNEPNMVYEGCSIDHSNNGISKRKKKFAEGHARAYDAIKTFSKKPVGVIFANGDIQSLNNDLELEEDVKFFRRYSFFDSIIRGDLSWYREFAGDDGSEKRHDMVNKVDWLGLNYYSRDVVSRNNGSWEMVKGYGHYCGDMEKSRDGRSVSDTGWEIYQDGIYNIIKDYWKRYKIPITITENGIADSNDRYRSMYIISHFGNIERAIEDGAKVDGYYHWALTDNYEWASGFSKKFGLVVVDMKTKERHVRPSALIYREIIENSGVPDKFRWIIDEKI